MKILVKSTGEIVSRILGGTTLTLDEAIRLVGTINPESKAENVEINGREFYYEDLELVLD